MYNVDSQEEAKSSWCSASIQGLHQVHSPHEESACVAVSRREAQKRSYRYSTARSFSTFDTSCCRREGKRKSPILRRWRRSSCYRHYERQWRYRSAPLGLSIPTCHFSSHASVFVRVSCGPGEDVSPPPPLELAHGTTTLSSKIG